MTTIAENLQTIVDIKEDIKTAIENKGVDMTNTPFTEYSTKIDEITTGGGTGKIDVAATGIKFAYSKFTEIPDIIDFSNVTDMSYMFRGCGNLTTLPNLDTSNVTDMSNMFSYCSNLTTIPLLDCGNVTNMGYMFSYSYSLTTIPLLDCGNVTNMSNMFSGSELTALTEIGGFKDLKISVTSNFLNKVPNLTTESLMNVINYLYDLTANGLSGKSLKFGQTNLDKLTEEQIAVATTKGWTLT